MKRVVKTTTLAAALLAAGVVGASAQTIDPRTDVPTSRSGTQIQTGEPAGVPPPGFVTGDPVPVAPGNGFGVGPGAGGAILVNPEVTPAPVVPGPGLMPDMDIDEDDFD
ncbi:MAG: hypothetical protein KJZ80_12080 [Hyphomicrobiaceae bacterium]|nr:hypothetical protein [Hyphomicrobiaceae bacterium]